MSRVMGGSVSETPGIRSICCLLGGTGFHSVIAVVLRSRGTERTRMPEVRFDWDLAVKLEP